MVEEKLLPYVIVRKKVTGPNIREQRYNDKVHHIAKRLGNAVEWIKMPEDSEMKLLATYKAIQEIFEGLSDVSSMILKDARKNPKDDYSNFEKLVEHGVITRDHQMLLNEGAGLRNRLVHSYNGLDDLVAIQSFKTMIDPIRIILETFQLWITNYFNE